MQTLGKFPSVRMRRMRHDDFSRRLMRESRVSVDDLIYPVFVIEGNNKRVQVPSPSCIKQEWKSYWYLPER